MNEQEARQRCDQLAAEHPDRHTHRWIAVPGEGGEWEVAKINLPPTGPTGTEVRADRKAPGEDPRTLPPWLDPPRGGLS